MHKKSQNSVAANTVPVTIVTRTVRKEPVFLARIIRRRSSALRSLTRPLSLAFFASYLFFIMNVLPERQ